MVRISHNNSPEYVIFDGYHYCQKIPQDGFLHSDISLAGLLESDPLTSTMAAFGVESIKQFCQQQKD
jgi:hypothetical protein